jgi:probable HAF family extracellular repeat protein
MKTTALVNAAALVAALMLGTAARAQATYRVVPMPDAPYPFSIDSAGKVFAIGWDHGRLLCGKAACNAILPRHGDYTWWAINDSHTLTGTVPGDGTFFVVRKAKLQKPERLTYGTGWAIAPDGAVVGQTNLGTPFVYTDHLQELPGIGGTRGRATAINADHVIVGESEFAFNLGNHATMWVDGVPTDLGVLDGARYSIAYAVNRSRVAVGVAYDGGRGFLPQALRFADGTVQKFRLPNAGDYAEASSINDAGTIVGWIEQPSQGQGVAGIVEGEKMVDLNKRLRAQDRARYHLYSAAWINNAGQIAATALDLQTDTQLAVRLDPVR